MNELANSTLKLTVNLASLGCPQLNVRCLERHGHVVRPRMAPFGEFVKLSASTQRLIFYGGIPGSLVAGYLYATTMPGRSHNGELPPMSPLMRSTAAELKGHVDALSAAIGERRIGEGHSLMRARDYVFSELEKIRVAGSELRVVAIAGLGCYCVLDVFAEIGGVPRKQHRLAAFELKHDREVARSVSRCFRECDPRAGAEVGRVQAKVLAGHGFIVDVGTVGGLSRRDQLALLQVHVGTAEVAEAPGRCVAARFPRTGGGTRADRAQRAPQGPAGGSPSGGGSSTIRPSFSKATSASRTRRTCASSRKGVPSARW